PVAEVPVLPVLNGDGNTHTMAIATPSKTPIAPGGITKASRRVRRLSTRDKIVLSLMVGIPTLVHVALVWLPTLVSVVLSFTKWDGIGGFDSIQWIGLGNYKEM